MQLNPRSEVTFAIVAGDWDARGTVTYCAAAETFSTGKHRRVMAAPPPWLEEFANAVAGHINPADLLSPLGCHYCYVDDQWEVTLFAAHTEILGGRKDGAIRSSKFSINLTELAELFNEVKECHWQSLPIGPKDDLGSHIAIDGTFAGENVSLRILATAPRRFRPGRLAHVRELVWEEMW